MPISSEKGGLAQLQDLVINNVGQITRYLLISIAILYIFVNLLVLILGSSEEGNVDNVKKGIGYVILGLMIISLSSEMAKIFDPILNFLISCFGRIVNLIIIPNTNKQNLMSNNSKSVV